MLDVGSHPSEQSVGSIGSTSIKPPQSKASESEGCLNRDKFVSLMFRTLKQLDYDVYNENHCWYVIDKVTRDVRKWQDKEIDLALARAVREGNDVFSITR